MVLREMQTPLSTEMRAKLAAEALKKLGGGGGCSVFVYVCNRSQLFETLYGGHHDKLLLPDGLFSSTGNGKPNDSARQVFVCDTNNEMEVLSFKIDGQESASLPLANRFSVADTSIMQGSLSLDLNLKLVEHMPEGLQKHCTDSAPSKTIQVFANGNTLASRGGVGRRVEMLSDLNLFMNSIPREVLGGEVLKALQTLGKLLGGGDKGEFLLEELSRIDHHEARKGITKEIMRGHWVTKEQLEQAILAQPQEAAIAQGEAAAPLDDVRAGAVTPIAEQESLSKEVQSAQQHAEIVAEAAPAVKEELPPTPPEAAEAQKDDAAHSQEDGAATPIAKESLPNNEESAQQHAETVAKASAAVAVKEELPPPPRQGEGEAQGGTAEIAAQAGGAGAMQAGAPMRRSEPRPSIPERRLSASEIDQRWMEEHNLMSTSLGGGARVFGGSAGSISRQRTGLALRSAFLSTTSQPTPSASGQQGLLTYVDPLSAALGVGGALLGFLVLRKCLRRCRCGNLLYKEDEEEEPLLPLRQ
ncbi:unnamed protein product [Amoebophrya sp. A25]|nr:unnamed protein product [Amoebophrya sp. A25]|eukprot:GSA25T00012527001.1